MNAPDSDSFLYRWLAAYADDELPLNERLRVERWLAENLDAHESLDAQESLAPSNAEFWNAVRPPEPTATQWDNTLNRIAVPVAAPQRRWVGWLSTAGLLATAATLFIALPGPQHPCLNPPTIDLDDLPIGPSDEMYPMASASDIRIVSLPESAAQLLVVGAHPIDSLLILAKADEVQFLGVGSDLDGQFPAVPADPLAADAPMIWAPTPKEPRDP